VSDILDNILKGIPAAPETPTAPPDTPPVQTPEQKKSSMTYSGDFEKQYGKKA